MTLEVLRDTIGDHAFFTVLRDWAAEHRGGNGSTSQFIALADHVSGHDLHPLFHAWLDVPRRPALPSSVRAAGGTGLGTPTFQAADHTAR
jgi:aminopeptidase N